METYLKRAYKQRIAKSKVKVTGVENDYPFWDYRSRRGSLSTSGTSTSGSSGSSSYDGCSISSVSSIRSADTASIHSNVSSSDSDSSMVTGDPYRLQLQFMVDSHEVLPLVDLYTPVTDWVDQDLDMFRVEERRNESEPLNQSLNQPKRFSRMPGLAVMLFLSEEGPLGYERLTSAQRHFEKAPWKFHHSEKVGQGKINPYPFNSSDYYYTSEELPLWAVRLVHCGKEFIRIVLFASQESWSDMLDFYKLVIGLEPDISKEDFCLFTMHSKTGYDVQFALKKLKAETKPRVLDSVKLKFRVKEVGSLVPLFPNVCKPISDRMWQTTDHDGNTIIIEVYDNSRPTSSTPSLEKEVTSSSYASRNSSRSSTQSVKSVQSLTSVTSSLTSSSNSSMTTVSSDASESAITRITRRPRDRSLLDDLPPKLPPRVPRKPKFVVPELPEEPKECLASLRGFYV